MKFLQNFYKPIIKPINTFPFLWFVLLWGCSSSSPTGSFRVAATPVPHAQMLEFIKPDLKAQGIDLEIVVVDDYNIPNRALANKEIDANFFQHIPFMEEQIRQFHYPIQSLAKIELEPMGIYSKNLHSLADLKQGASIAIPNDPTNEGRALLLLQSEGLIELEPKGILSYTVINISQNPKRLQFIEADAAMLPRSLDDVAAAAINTNYALQAGLNPLKDALAIEGPDSPYVNIVAIRSSDVERPEIQALKTAMTSEAMRQFILDHYKQSILPAF